jgi:hypothetical protein
MTEYIPAKELPFVPLQEICSQVILNPNCKKAKVAGSHTFDPPHRDISLRQLLEQHGHQPPAVVLSAEQPEGIYLEDVREPCEHMEDTIHHNLIKDL